MLISLELQAKGRVKEDDSLFIVDVIEARR